MIIYEPFYIDNLMNYYLPRSLVAYGFPRYGENGQFRDTDAQIYQDLARIVGPAKRVWAVRSFQNVPSVGFRSYKTDQWLLEHGYTLAQHEVLNKIELSSRFDRIEADQHSRHRGGGAVIEIEVQRRAAYLRTCRYSFRSPRRSRLRCT